MIYVFIAARICLQLFLSHMMAVQCNFGDEPPVADGSPSAGGTSLLSGGVDHLSLFENGAVLPLVTGVRRDVLDLAMQMLGIVPAYEPRYPTPRLLDVRKWAIGIFRHVLERFKQRLSSRARQFLT